MHDVKQRIKLLTILIKNGNIHKVADDKVKKVEA